MPRSLFGASLTLIFPLLLSVPLHAETPQAAGAAHRDGAALETVDFELPDLDGKKHRLSDYRGKWVVVNYWATWCPPCLEEIPELVDFHEAHKDKDAVVLGIDFETVSLKKLKQFSEEYFISYPVLRTTPGPRGELGEISGLPTTYLISPQGEIAARQVGGVTAKMITDFIARQQTTAPQVDEGDMP